MPFAFGDTMTGTHHASANRRSGSHTASSFASMPTISNGRLLSRSRAAASRTASPSIASVGCVTKRGSATSTASCFGTSLGASMSTGPRRCASATRSARSVTADAFAGVSDARHFVIGAYSALVSSFWCVVMAKRSAGSWPVNASSGPRSSHACATPVTRFVAPGPSVPTHTPGTPVALAIASAMNAAGVSCLVSTNSRPASRKPSMRSTTSPPG